MKLISGDKVECIKSGLLIKCGSTGVIVDTEEWGDCTIAVVEWDSIDVFTTRKNRGADHSCGMNINNLKKL